MAVKNSLTKAKQKLGMAAYLTNDAVKAQISKIVGGKDGARFITSVISAVQNNPQLQECTNQSILSAALLGESLKLSPSPQLGHFYMVPFNNNREHCKEAQFQLGYKGYVQLALRSGQYRKLNVLAIKEGELVRYDPLNEEIEVNLIQDEEVRESTPTAGYYAMFEYINGFRKTMYWSKEKMVEHAKKYSNGFRKDLQKGTSYTFWSKDFDGMAYKTMLRQLISKWGIMSIELQQAIDGDMAVIHEDGTRNYVEIDDAGTDTQAADEIPETEKTANEEPKQAKEEPVTVMQQDEEDLF